MSKRQIKAEAAKALINKQNKIQIKKQNKEDAKNQGKQNAPKKQNKQQQNTKDIVLEGIQLCVPKKQLLVDTDLRIANKRKYGLIGHNGLGKSTLLKAIASRELPIPKNIDVYYVDQETYADPSKTVFQVVLEANRKREKWLARSEELKKQLEDDDTEDYDDQYNILLEKYKKVMEKLNNMSADKDAAVVHQILSGLGFEHTQHDWTTDKFSGGWRMRISLAKAIFMTPSCLLLDEINNHLDLNTTIYVIDLFKKWKKTLLIVSHDRSFLNEICTDIIHLADKKLTYYKGNYDQFISQYDQYIDTMNKEWNKIQSRVKEMQHKSIPRKDVDEFLKINASKEPPKVYKPKINFMEFDKIGKTLITLENISFGYNDENLFEDVSFNIEEGTRYTLVGKNGVGKSTLIKLLAGELKPRSGYIRTDTKARIGYFHQHSSDVLPLDQTPIEYIHSVNKKVDLFQIRALLGSIGLDGKTHNLRIGDLSGGQKARVSFVELQSRNPNILILDEPTNSLDIQTITSLITSLKQYKGGLITITHNLDLIRELDCQLLEIEDGKCRLTDIETYFAKVLEVLE